jgi:hypothetical protein
MASEALNWALANGMTQAEFDRNIFNAVLDAQKPGSGVTDSMLRSEMDRLGISPADAAQLAAANAAQLALVQRQNEAALALQQRNAAAAAEAARLAALQRTAVTTPVTTPVTTFGLLAPTGATSVTGTTPFANATQGFEQNFRNYTSIPIGAQYNPNVVGGTGSPYAQVMGQMRPVGNPYANVVAGQAMGGYNPALYDQIAAANLANTAAATAAAATPSYQQESTGLAKGGYVHGGLMFGANPPGPDDGAVNLDMGEYVIKKSSVNKYGKGLLDMINEGKVPAKKLKSLLG